MERSEQGLLPSLLGGCISFSIFDNSTTVLLGKARRYSWWSSVFTTVQAAVKWYFSVDMEILSMIIFFFVIGYSQDVVLTDEEGSSGA